MLKHLYISNFTLINELDMNFNPGFSVITGETGAGKSIIIGAVSMLLGNRADLKMIRNGKDKCIVEAVFSISDYDQDFINRFLTDNDLDNNGDECILRREININGKNRAFINDTPVILASLKELGEHLLDIHSQHQNLMLNKEDFQLSVIDVFAQNKKILAEYQDLFKKYKSEAGKLEELQAAISRIKENEDFLQFQNKELSEANLEEGEQESLEQQSELLTHAEEIKNTLYNADSVLSSDEHNIITQLRSLSDSMNNIQNVYPDAEVLTNRLNDCVIELKDISREIVSHVEDIDYDPEKLQAINSRLDTIYTLEKKYHTSNIPDLIKKHEEIKSQLSRIDNFDVDFKAQQDKVDRLKESCLKKANALTASRQKAARKVEKELAARLIPLGIPNVKFKIDMTQQKELTAKGLDRITYLFSSNSSSSLSPIAQVASGGEVSRVMLSLKAMMSRVTGLPTIIFDEIDTGVSGRVAEQMAHIMKEMGDNKHQVICITHLPQIAAIGSTHYKVTKTETSQGTNSLMTLLSPEERVKEIAQMLSGSDISIAAIENARTLLKLN
jgi:DNA repair protein RecN (Recombination protein N)